MFNGNIDLTPMINIAIKIIALVWAFKLLPLIKSKLSESQFNKLRAVTEAAVYAAEKLYGAGHGDEKLDWAIREIEKKGFTADRTVIEEFVMKLSLEMDWWGDKGDTLIEEEEDDIPLLSDPGDDGMPREDYTTNTVEDE